MIKIKLDPSAVIRNYNQLKRDVPKATASAINKTGKQALNQGKRDIRAEYNIKSSDLNKNVYFTRSHQNRLTAFITGLGRALSLKYFSARQTNKGVSFKIKKAGGRKLIKSGFGPDIPRLGGNVFTRVGKERLPIKKHFSIGVAAMLGSKKIVDKIQKYFYENFPRIAQHEIDYYLKKLK